ncbi:flagellar hook-basal body complex protein [Loktanella salsilacus]|uniref:flagellar hook protein FlgE n=1 Tax=Loktanella salsilacus TaxID=195913 RepID=UPI0030FB584F
MTISSSLNAGVAGLSANASRLATISDNISNSSTFGYKRAETDFHSLVLANSQGSYSAGGVRVTNQRIIDQSGSLVATDNATDIAVRGRGMFPVVSQSAISTGNVENSMMLQTTASFRTDAEGYLRSPAGLVLMAWPADADGAIPNYPRNSAVGLAPVKIDANQSAGQATTEMALALNLPAISTDETSDGAAEAISIQYYDNLGKSANLSVVFTPTVPATGSSNEWTMTVSDSASGGAVVGEYTLTFDDTRGAGGTLQSVATVSGGAYDPVTGILGVNVAGGPIDLSIGTLGNSQGLTQLSTNFTPVSISKNGTQVGSLTSIEIDQNGYVRASFDTGVNQVLYQIPMIDVPNINGLEAVDGQAYRISPDSGEFFMWDAGDGPTGEIVAYAREESTTDVASELTDLIQTQRAYSSNAKVIQTVDEMLQETTNIKR